MHDLTFRILIAAALAGTVGISGFYRRRADALDRKISMGQEGRLPVALIRLALLAHLAGLLAYLIHPQWMDWARLPLPQAVRWAGVGGMYLCIPLILWLLRHLGKNITPTIEVRRQASLVTSGPYRWIRHPLYSVGTLSLLSMSAAASSAYFLASSLCAVFFVVWRTPREEARLVERFGDDYREYMRRTGRYLPRVFGDFTQSRKQKEAGGRRQETGRGRAEAQSRRMERAGAKALARVHN